MSTADASIPGLESGMKEPPVLTDDLVVTPEGDDEKALREATAAKAAVAVGRKQREAAVAAAIEASTGDLRAITEIHGLPKKGGVILTKHKFTCGDKAERARLISIGAAEEV